MEAKALQTELSIDKCSTREEALKVAIAAIELYMKASKQVTGDAEKARITRKCKALVVKAEEIKKSSTWPLKPSAIFSDAPVSDRTLSKHEEIILLEGSKLHGFIFPRWTSEPDNTVFETSSYTDPSELKLSEAQIETFAGWKRPHERDDIPFQRFQDVEDALMNASKDIDLVQDITTDCSVVASLCAATARAGKGHSKVLATILRPFDVKSQRPRSSKNGKYVLRLQFNGCYRRVTIDDRLPASSSARNLHVVDRNNPMLLWPALVEKAYLKVRGGYDFPGSNSGTDLWIMTGWIPEQIFLQSDEIQSELLWKRIFKSFEFGDVMITLGTGKLSRREEADLGLVGEHDYAILDMREPGSQRLLLVKNPWCDGMAWKGPRRRPAGEESEGTTWTGDLRQSLEETGGQNSSTKPGTFWMALEDVIQNFESLYLNWNPGLFRYRQDHHLSWTIPHVNTIGTFTQNPQYVVQSSRGETIWVLLSRHFLTEEHDIAQGSSTQSIASSSLGFISLYVFDASGHRVYLSDGALHRGAYVDSPQTLARFELPANTPYTVVAAQQNLPLPKYSFSFSFFSRFPLNIHSAPDSFTFSTSNNGSWTTRTAGGNASSPSYPSNPQFSISVQEPTDMMLVLEADREDIAVHVTMIWANGERVTVINSRDIVGGSGDYRRGCALAELRNVAAGKYTIVCSTFQAGETGNFILRVKSSKRCEIRPVLAETAGRLVTRLPTLIFQEGIDRMLAPVTVTRLTRLRFVAKAGNSVNRPTPSKSRPGLRLSIEQGQGPNKTLLESSCDGEFSDAPAGIRTSDRDISPDMMLKGGIWVVLERLGGRLGFDDVCVEALSDSQVSIGVWGTGDG
ncbi:4146cbde-6597-48a2-9b53-79edff8f5b5c [Sclerotinia trifoliorum]|uniref:4146cbde-6597-48a2-9b53-79edff8f5b5c n=1 Tax=Sclerotinia trifoliorum TaxID=28548 RepID=A0A8H2VRK3_9HELO|nr:4146cbde-6597-48a2-9b53-79edff8f5b5c [Sclerotinia trifoliorum]